ncbi:MAG: sensor histidine kinase [Veillonella sp.]|uniref:sensor histidine kinase n=1 Tax=Veillonella sp. TaxID=1926307 RepID=UPI0025FEF773|nr:histidine kinase dimerization/phosphoacceptor domain -containing protein [Veillonella sp.]MBS4912725.1 sensor histidine kinase [Veillonella sp.]
MNIAQMLETKTNLNPVQQQLLIHITKLLPFANSLPQQSVFLYTLHKDGTILHWTPLSRRSHKKRLQTDDKTGYKFSQAGDTPVPRKELVIMEDGSQAYSLENVSAYELALWNEVFNTGHAVKGFMERSHGNLDRLMAFPIKDNGGKCIGGIAVVHTGFMQQDEHRNTALSDVLGETTYLSMLVPAQTQLELYKPLSYKDGVIIFDEAGIILYANEPAARLVDLLGFDRRLLGTSIYGGSLKMSWVKEALRNHRGAVSEEIYGNIIVEQTIIPVSTGHRSKRSFLLLKDRTEYRRQEQALLVKNSVIKEIHHRVKNNLQVVAGLLRMESRRSDNEEVKKALREGVSRIESMALVHELISHYDEDYINLRTIGEELFRLLRRAMVPSDKTVFFSYDGPDVELSSHRAGYVSLILNELISNSMEHGFNFLSEENSGATTHSVQSHNEWDLMDDKQIKADALNRRFRIKMKVTKTNGEITLVLSDSGVGFPSDFDIVKTSRLGLQIIKNLVENELNGSIHCGTAESHGAAVTITFSDAE